MVDQLPAHQSINVPASALTASIAATAKNKENPYIKPGVGKCYRCGELDTSVQGGGKST